MGLQHFPAFSEGFKELRLAGNSTNLLVNPKRQCRPIITAENNPALVVLLGALVLLAVGFELFPFKHDGATLHATAFFSGFGHEALIAVGALMVAGQGLVRTDMTCDMPMWTAMDEVPWGDPADMVRVVVAIAEGRLEISGREWTQHSVTLRPDRSDGHARLVLLAHAHGDPVDGVAQAAAAIDDGRAGRLLDLLKTHFQG